MMNYLACSLSVLLLSNTSTAQVASPSENPTVNPVARVTDISEQMAVANCGPRIRNPWELLLSQEKDVYLREIAKSMDDGYYIRFPIIRVCLYTGIACCFGFREHVAELRWRILLHTVPYWNYVDDNQRYMMSGCRNMEECSLLLQDFGGSLNGIDRSVTINGSPIQGTCVVTPPLDQFCEATHLNGGSCARCVPRGNWLRSPFPPTTTVSSLARQLSATPTIAGVVSNLELGIQSKYYHNALSGAMGVLEGPADPIFFSHHASVDLLHSFYYKCVVGNTEPITLAQKFADPRVYTECPRRQPLPVNAIDRTVLSPLSNVFLRMGEQGVNLSSVF
ncbi:hypothetical protein PsorP6_006299 [Peronosclerospora sorghi]|uniref:Uncharacterized protein n=1 Tax=Peronosclerospora sorghi TaxID=230839 RepID=A0ACC0W4L4_9STRA|nr:hypothetical protein PsorP6_006299 [Peronosclerospora sorghi]